MKVHIKLTITDDDGSVRAICDDDFVGLALLAFKSVGLQGSCMEYSAGCNVFDIAAAITQAHRIRTAARVATALLAEREATMLAQEDAFTNALIFGEDNIFSPGEDVPGGDGGLQ